MSELEGIDLNNLAFTLRAAQATGEPCAPLRQLAPELSVDDAYAIQRLNIAWRQGNAGRLGRPTRRVGHKIGITSEAVMAWLKVREPDFGVLLDDMAVDDGGELHRSWLLQPRVEGELAFILDRDLQGPGVTAADVLRATDFVLPAIEIVDSRIQGWDISIVDTIADNASSAFFALGSRPIAPSAIDLRLIGMVMRKNGAVEATGAGAASLGNPLRALAWLANKLADHEEHLRAGDIVLSGALGPVTEVRAGDAIEVQIGARDRVNVRFIP